MWSLPLITMSISFALDLTVMAFYFSTIISTKASLHKYGLIISFLGVSGGTMFSLLMMLLPEMPIPWLDMEHILVFVIWLPLMRHYAQTSWLESFIAALFGILLYAVVSLLVTALILGFWQIFVTP